MKFLSGDSMKIKDANGKVIGHKFLDDNAIQELGLISEYKQKKGQIENRAKNGEKIHQVKSKSSKSFKKE